MPEDTMTPIGLEILDTLDRIISNLEKVANGGALRTSPATEAIFLRKAKPKVVGQDPEFRDRALKTNG